MRSLNQLPLLAFLLTLPFWLVGQTVYESTFRWNGAGVQSELAYIESLGLEESYGSVAAYLAGEGVSMEDFLAALPWDNQWTNLANWEVLNESDEWVTATVLPSLQDVVQVEALQTTSFGNAIDVTAGAEAGFFHATGLMNTSSVQVVGDAEFGRILLAVGTSNSRESSFQVGAGVVLTVSGGLLDPTELTFHAPTGPRSTLAGSAGNLEYTGAEIAFTSGSNNSGAIPWTFSNPDSVVQVGGALLPTVAVLSTQTFLGTGELTGSVSNLGGGSLDNLAGIRITVTGRFTETTYAGGTYHSFYMSTNLGTISGTGNAYLAGDFFLAGSFLLEDQETAFALSRLGSTQTPSSNFFTQGHRFEVLTDALVVVGLASNGVGQALLNVNDSEVVIPGSMVINDRGRLQGNAISEIRLGGDFLNFSTQSTTFNLTQSTLALVGDRDAATAQMLEVAGTNLGLDEAGFVDNFALGQLIIGSEETATYVLLQDFIDQSGQGADALYVGELLVHAGSTFNLNYLSLFTYDAENNLVKVMDGDTRFGDGLIIIPEPSLAMLLVLLPIIVLGSRRMLA